MQHSLPLEQRQQKVSDVLRMIDSWLLKDAAGLEFTAFLGEFFDGFEVQSGGHSLEKVRGLVAIDAARHARLVALEAFFAGAGVNVFERFREAHLRELNYDNVAYFRSLKGSVMTIFKTLKVTPMSHVMVKDVMFDTGPHRVGEVLGSTWMTAGGYFAGRLLKVDGMPRFSGGIVPLGEEQALTLVDRIVKHSKLALLDFPADVRTEPDTGRQALLDILAQLPAAVAGIHLINHANLPVNRSKESLEVVFQIFGGSKHVTNALASASDFAADGDRWCWIPTASTKGSTVEAELWIEDENLIATVESSRQLKAMRTRLRRLLGDRLGNPLRRR